MKYKHINPETIPLNEKEMFRVLDDDGNVIDKNYKQVVGDDQLLKGYEYMVLSRQQDTYMAQLQKQGRMLTFAPNFGEEALQVATAMAMDSKDWFLPAFRSNAAMLYLGVPLVNQITYWNGQELGSKMPLGVNVLPINIVIGTQISQAAGVAMGMKSRNEKNVAVTFIGNGGTTEGEFYEALNFAAIWKWPLVVCINNNQWAISTRNERESVSKTLAAKGVAAGVPGVRVDGNDLLASYEIISEAIEYAKEGNGPIIVEFVSWRQGQHTTSDNPRIYRTVEEEKEAEKSEPFHRIEKYLIDNKIIDQDKISKIWENKLEEVKVAFNKSVENINTKIEDIFDYTYEKLDEDLMKQKKNAVEFFSNKGGK